MSWLFGSRKKTEEPKVTVEPDTSINSDGYVVVNSPYNSPVNYHLYPQLARPSQPAPPLPYSVRPHSQPQQYPPRTNGEIVHSNPLDSIPFKLSKDLSTVNSSTPGELSVIHNSLVRIRNDLESGLQSYNFSVEKNVIHEANICNNKPLVDY